MLRFTHNAAFSGPAPSPRHGFASGSPFTPKLEAPLARAPGRPSTEARRGRVCRAAAVLICLSVATQVRAGELEDDWATITNFLSGIQGAASSPPSGIVTSKYTSGMLLGNGDLGVVVGGTVSTQVFYFGKNDFWGTSAGQNSILTLGGLTISSPTTSSNPSAYYTLTQDILNAEVRSTLQLGNAVIRSRSWTADATNAFITELTSDPTNGPVVINAGLWVTNDPVYPHSAGVSNGTPWLTRENDLTGSTSLKCRAAYALVLVGGAFDSTRTDGTNVASGTFTLNGGATVDLLVVFQTDTRIGQNGPSRASLAAAAVNRAVAATSIDLVNWQADHRAWWKNFWLKSYVRVYDSVLEKFYYGALYVVGAASRAGKVPPGLWGPWPTQDAMSWGGRFFINYNFEAPFYGVCSANRPELILPYTDFVLAEEPFQQNKTAAAGYHGVTYQRSYTPADLFNSPPSPAPVASTRNWASPVDQKSNGTFVSLPCMWYYEYTLDTNYLRTQALSPVDSTGRLLARFHAVGRRPLLRHQHVRARKRVVQFERGRFESKPRSGFHPEGVRPAPGGQPTLGTNSGMMATWSNVLANLSPYPTGITNGVEVYYIAQVVNNPTTGDNLFEPGNQPINMEGGVYPGENIFLGGDPAAIQIATNSLQQMNSWGVTSGGNSNNGFPKIFPIAARVGWPAADLINKFKAAINYHWRSSNLTVFQGGGGIETSGSIEGLNSMLLQSEGGVLRVFPVWPTNWNASFKRLRAKGAFVVSSALSNGAVSSVDVTSEQGRPVSVAQSLDHRHALRGPN